MWSRTCLSLKISDNQKPLIEEEQTIQWPQQKHNRTKKSTQKTKEEYEPTKSWGELNSAIYQVKLNGQFNH
jgi:hypothetical protein